MALHLSQQLRQSQRLVMTPQMQQSIALLQMNSLELEQHLETELAENPFLEISDRGEEDDQLVGSEVETADVAGEGRDFEDGDDDWMNGAEPGAAADVDSLGGDAAPALALTDGAASEAPGDLDPALMPADEGRGTVDVDFDSLFDDTEPRLNSSSYEQLDEENDFTTYTAMPETLYEKLRKQLYLAQLEGKQLDIGEYILGLLDEDGYLRTPVEEIAEEFSVEPCDVEDVLMVIQSFEPTGVAARDLPECLMLQMEELGVKDRDYYRVVRNHFKQLQGRKFREITKALNVPESKLSEIFNYIIKLDPHPGRRYAAQEVRHIKPDVFVKEVDGEYLYYVNEGRAGALRINKFYRDLLARKEKVFTGAEREFAMSKFKNAVWLIKNIEKRKGTVLRVTEAIMQFQKEFLTRGVEALRPLTLKEIAAMVDMHESTIARVTTGKYVETPQGTFELKYFFSSGLETEDGEDASSRSIKEKIREIIGDEDARKPLSDQKIANMLQKSGLRIARRTVAKYREQMKFLPAKLRRKV